jgi:hypothetical protein
MGIICSSLRRAPGRGADVDGESTAVKRRLMLVAAVLLALAAFPGAALAHGPVAPLASSYLARIAGVPAGVDAKVVDGDQRMWLQVVPSETVVVLDYRGAPYLRFSPAGVQVNQNSAMYYLNQTPVAEPPPPNLSAATPPSWALVSGGHQYGWHDGRLHALATVALAPGAGYIGRWIIPVQIDGRRSAISGGLWYAGAPSIAWFWPVVVIIACVLAAWRLRRPRLDALAARACAIAALLGIAVAAVGRGFHGRPVVGVFQLVEMGLLLALVVWLLMRVVRIRGGYFRFFAIAFIALWEGIELIPTLRHGFVLMAMPEFLARAATVVCLGCGAGLMVLAIRLSDRPEELESPDRVNALDGDDEGLRESFA